MANWSNEQFVDIAELTQLCIGQVPRPVVCLSECVAAAPRELGEGGQEEGQVRVIDHPKGTGNPCQTSRASSLKNRPVPGSQVSAPAGCESGCPSKRLTARRILISLHCMSRESVRIRGCARSRDSKNSDSLTPIVNPNRNPGGLIQDQV